MLLLLFLLFSLELDPLLILLLDDAAAIKSEFFAPSRVATLKLITISPSCSLSILPLSSYRRWPVNAGTLGTHTAPSLQRTGKMASYSQIQKTINDTIRHPEFSAALPPLSEATWRKILVGRSAETVLENDRLEFLGDALMYATIGRQLYAQCPQGSPHLYTVSFHVFIYAISYASLTVCSLAITRCTPLQPNIC